MVLIEKKERKTRKAKPLLRDLEVGDVTQNKVNERLIAFLAHKVDKALALERLAAPVRRQAILGKGKVKHVDNW